MARGVTPRVALAALLLAMLALAWAPALASAKTNASAAAGFIEDAQNNDGGFGAKHGQASAPTPSLWATVALLAAGKNPRDELVKGGRTAEAYLVSHLGVYTSLT